jgi:hypothetical protein
VTTFRDILAHRGRIVVFTPNAVVALAFEQMAERQHAQVVCTRGWADPYGPLLAWNRIYAAREYGVLSCDQKRYIEGYKIHATDLVWVGNPGDPDVEVWLYTRRMKALHLGDEHARQWMIGEQDL